MRKVKVIFATGRCGEFSKNGEMPWGDKPLEGDGANFKLQTKDAVVIMGLNTWKSLPFKLPNRINVVLTSSGDGVLKEDKNSCYVTPDWILSGGLKEVVETLKATYEDKDIYIIGGSQLILTGINYCDEVSWTKSAWDYPNSDFSFDLDRLQGLLILCDFKEYSVTQIKNEKFGLGADCKITTYIKEKKNA